MPGRCARIAPLSKECEHTLKYVVVFARYQDRWIFVRHRNRTTWELPGGHIEPGESPLKAAKRELYEEAGAKDARLDALFDYWAYDVNSSSWGQVFLAEVNSLMEIPPEYEMAERRFCEAFPPPEELTYAYIGKALFPAVEEILKNAERFNLPKSSLEASPYTAKQGIRAAIE